MDTVEDTINLRNKLRSRSTSSTSLGSTFTMSHFMDKLAMSFGWGPNPLKVMSVSWTDYKDRLDEDSLNVAVAAMPHIAGEKTPAWEVIIHFAINAHNHCYSLQRSSSRSEARAAASCYRETLPPLVAAVGKELLNHSTLQKVTDLLRECPSYKAIHLAAYFGFLDALKNEQIKKCINERESSNGHTALHIAVRQESERVVTALLAAGADVAAADTANADTPLHLAAAKQEAIILALNVEEHSSLNMKNKQGKTALMIAAEQSRLDNVKLLLRLGANPNHEPHLHSLYHTPQYKQGLKTIDTAKDISSKDLSKGGNVLHWVKTRELMHLCLDLGIAPNVQNNAGQTPVHVMVIRQRVPCLVTLLSRGADPNIADFKGNTPLHIAAKMLSPTMVQALIVFGSHVGLVNSLGETARHLAASQRTEDPTQQNCRDQVIYLLHAVGAPRCTSRLAVCCEGCISDGQFNGVPVYHKPLVRSRWVMDQLLELSQINQAIQWQSQHQPHLRGTGRVLCLDGGGIKGLVLTQQLFVLEKALGRPISECFDWICGTSTGGFLALMLSTGKSVKAVQTLYYSLKEKVFVGSRPYDSVPLEEVLRKEFGEEATMSSITGLKVMVTSTLADRLPPDLHLFRNYESPMSVIGLPESTHFAAPLPPDKQKIWLAARSSGAAPTYFSALEQFVDGGMIANNPTLDTLTEIEEWNMAVRSKGRHHEVFVPTVIVSLGCGKAPLAKVENIDVVVPSLLDMRRGFQAVYNLFNLLVDSACPSQGRVTDRARAWCAALHVPFIRLNPQLSCDINLDESSDEKLLRIMWEARAEMQRNSKMVDHLKYLLIPPDPEQESMGSSASETRPDVSRSFSSGESVAHNEGFTQTDGTGNFGSIPENYSLLASTSREEAGRVDGSSYSTRDPKTAGSEHCLKAGLGDSHLFVSPVGWTVASPGEEPLSIEQFNKRSGKFQGNKKTSELDQREKMDTEKEEPSIIFSGENRRRKSSAGSSNEFLRAAARIGDGRTNRSAENINEQFVRRVSFDKRRDKSIEFTTTSSSDIGGLSRGSGVFVGECFPAPSVGGSLIPQLSVPNLSELLARSGVDPSSLASSMPEILDSLSDRHNFGDLEISSQLGSSNLPDDSNPTTGAFSSAISSSSDFTLPYPISDPPGYPYVVNNVDPYALTFLPVNPLNPILASDVAEDGRSSSLGLGFCPDSPASIRSLRLLEESANAACSSRASVESVAQSSSRASVESVAQSSSRASVESVAQSVVAVAVSDGPQEGRSSQSTVVSTGSSSELQDDRGDGAEGDNPPSYNWALRNA